MKIKPISIEADYLAALCEVESLMTAKSGTEITTHISQR